MAPLAMPTAHRGADASAQSDDLEPQGRPTVSDRQQGFLDALEAGGITPPSELHALSIGSYVCQARAAGQDDQAVWDYVLPLVRSEVRAAHPDDDIVPPDEVENATAEYIHVATEQLC